MKVRNEQLYVVNCFLTLEKLALNFEEFPLQPAFACVYLLSGGSFLMGITFFRRSCYFSCSWKPLAFVHFPLLKIN